MQAHPRPLRVLLIAAVLAGQAASGAAEPAPARPAAKSAPVRATPKPKPEEPPAKIEGTVIARAKGFLGLRIVDNQFVLTFYDAKRKKTAPDVPRAALRWSVKYQPGPERTVLNPAGDGFSLSSQKTVRPPHAFKVFISLLPATEGAEVESYAVDFSG